MEQSAAVKKFVARIKLKYIERRLNREKQWPPCKSEKLVRLELVEGEQRQGYSAGQTRGKDDKAVKRSPLAYSDILKAKDGRKTVRKVLVEGDAGIGKTTLCTALSEDWANEKLFQEFEILLLLHLRQKKIASAGSLLGLLKLLHSSSEICTLVAEYIEDQNEGKVLIIADGWDELSTKDCSEGSFLYELLFGECYSLSVVVTSRPSASVTFHELPCIDRFVEVHGFSNDNIKGFIQCEFASDRAKGSGLLAQLEGNPLIESVCSVPLNCTIVCHLWDCFDGALPTTMSELYTKIILNVTLRNIQKKSEYESIRSLPHFESLPDSLQQPWSLLCKLAFQTLSEDKIIVSHEDLGMRFKDLPLDSEVFCFGLLQSAESILVDGHGVSFHFLHLTFQEYLAALYLVRQPTDKQLQLCQSYAGSWRFEMVWRFFFGLSFSVCNKPMGVDVSKLLVDAYTDLKHGYGYDYNSMNTLSLCHFAFEANQRTINDLIISKIIVRSVEFKARVAFDSTAIIHVIANLRVFHCVISISLCDCGLRDEHITALADALAGEHRNLQVDSINFRGNRLTDKSLAVLFERASPAFSQSLRSVDLSNNRIGPKVVNSLTSVLAKSFSVIMKSPNPFDNYTQLDISDNHLGVDGCKVLRDALYTNKLASLKCLCLARSLTNDADANAKLILALTSSDPGSGHRRLERLNQTSFSYPYSCSGHRCLESRYLTLSYPHSGSGRWHLQRLNQTSFSYPYSGSGHRYLESCDLSLSYPHSGSGRWRLERLDQTSFSYPYSGSGHRCLESRYLTLSYPHSGSGRRRLERLNQTFFSYPYSGSGHRCLESCDLTLSYPHSGLGRRRLERLNQTFFSYPYSGSDHQCLESRDLTLSYPHSGSGRRRLERLNQTFFSYPYSGSDHRCLEWLDLAPISYPGSSGLGHPYLEWLDLIPLSYRDSPDLSHPCLESLNLNPLSYPGSPDLSHLCLESLNLAPLSYTGSPGTRHPCSLESLDLSQNNLGAPGGMALGVILSDLQLHTLYLTETRLGDEGIAAFLQNLKATVTHELRELYLDDNGIQAAGISCLAKSMCTGRLKLMYGYFTLANNPLGLEGVIDVVKILTSDHFQAGTINLSGCQLTTAGGNATNHNLSAVGVQRLIYSQQLQAAYSNLNIIMIDNNNFSGEGIHILASFLYSCQKNLNEVSCRSCGITSNDLKQLLLLLSELKLTLSSLHSWDLSNNDIDDDGVSALIQHLSMFPALSSDSITLDGNMRISLGMVKTLEELKAREIPAPLSDHESSGNWHCDTSLNDTDSSESGPSEVSSVSDMEDNDISIEPCRTGQTVTMDIGGTPTLATMEGEGVEQLQPTALDSEETTTEAVSESGSEQEVVPLPTCSATARQVQRLDQEVDFEHDGVSKHLGQIADAMYEWEGPIAEQLELTRADVAAINKKHPGELKLQTRAALELWKQSHGSDATYNNLIKVFERAGYRDIADIIKRTAEQNKRRCL